MDNSVTYNIDSQSFCHIFDSKDVQLPSAVAHGTQRSDPTQDRGGAKCGDLSGEAKFDLYVVVTDRHDIFNLDVVLV
jgi:hypothetical protein